MAQMDDLLFILLTLVSLTSAEADNQIIIRRGYFHNTYAVDFFSYTNNNICGNASYVHKWCSLMSSYELSNNPVSYRCSCQCFSSHRTFFPMKEECVDDGYLKTSGVFGNGVYKFRLQVDFSKKSTNGAVLFSSSNNCYDCQIVNVMYFENDQWESSSLNLSINKFCRLSWTLGSGKVAGKILKFQLISCSYRQHNQSVFLKSKGKYVIDVPAPPPPTVAASSISSSVDSTDASTFTSSSTSTATPTSALKTSTHQVSEFVTSSRVSPTKAFIASSYVHACGSDGNICPSSSSAAVLLPTTEMYTSTKINHDYQSSPSSSSTWPIIAAVVACIVVGGIVALVVVLRRRNSRNRERSSGNSVKAPVPDSTGNPMYGHNRGDVISLPNRQSQPQQVEDEEYDYATVDGGRSDHQKPSEPPVYQSLIKENVRDSVYAPLNKEATEPTTVEYSYNHLQHPQYNPARSKKDPLYNTLEPPNNDEYLEPGTQISDNPTGVSEPVYNVLDGPYPNSDPQDKDPVYNVLEDPNVNQYSQDNDPVYNVLKDPNANQYPQDNDPVYNVLEDPNANQYPQDNDPVYNVLEDPNANQYPQDNDPVYNVLEDSDDNYDNAPIDDDQDLPASGQDNVAYSSTIDLNLPQSPSSPDYDVLEGPEGALPDSTYQALGIRVQDDVYQPLDRTSQPIYQSLEPNDSTA